MTPITEKQLVSLKIAADLSSVTIGFNNMVKNEDTPEKENEEVPVDEEDTYITHEYRIVGKHRPHKDLVDSMKKLRKFALEVCEIEIDSKAIGTWTVSAIKISGDVLMKQSRVIMTLAHTVHRTGKVLEMRTSQVTMYPEKDESERYHNVEKMTPIIEDIIEEGFSYLNGKIEDEDSHQLPLFATDMKRRKEKATV